MREQRGERGGRENREGREGRTRGKERESGERGKEVRHTHNWVNIPLAAKKILFTYQQTPAHNTATENYPNLVNKLLLFGAVSIH